jgi:TM2 domain-containing membrane protein YozV
MKSKNTAAFLAFVSGFAGTHQFYLGNVMAGLAIIFLMTVKFKLAFFIAIIQGIYYLTLSQEDFDRKYARGYSWRNRWDNRRGEYSEREESYRPYTPPTEPRTATTVSERWNTQPDTSSPFKKEGIAKYKDFDFKGAIIAFEKALVSEPYDSATLFNLACSYSCLEDKDKAFDYLSKAVATGTNNAEKIQKHDGLAFLRVQPEWEEFVANGYRLTTVA